jgi:hypothetical protein
MTNGSDAMINKIKRMHNNNINNVYRQANALLMNYKRNGYDKIYEKFHSAELNVLAKFVMKTKKMSKADLIEVYQQYNHRPKNIETRDGKKKVRDILARIAFA